MLHIAEIERLARKIDTMETNLTATFVGEMEKRGFSSTAFKTSDITAAVSEVSKKMFSQISDELKGLKEAFKSSYGIGVADDVVIADGAVAFAGGCVIIDEDEWFDDADGAEGAPPNESGERRLQLKRKEVVTSAQLVKKRRYTVGHHHGRLNVLPRNFKFTSLTPFMLVECWLLGSERHNIPPLARLDSKSVYHLPGGNKTRSKMAAVMRVVEKMAKKKRSWIGKMGDWDYDKVIKMWDDISPEFEQLYCQTKRRKQITYSTVYANMTKVNAFNNPRNKKFQQQATVLV